MRPDSAPRTVAAASGHGTTEAHAQVRIVLSHTAQTGKMRQDRAVTREICNGLTVGPIHEPAMSGLLVVGVVMAVAGCREHRVNRRAARFPFACSRRVWGRQPASSSARRVGFCITLAPDGGGPIMRLAGLDARASLFCEAGADGQSFTVNGYRSDRRGKQERHRAARVTRCRDNRRTRSARPRRSASDQPSGPCNVQHR
jgi:hypothetical protein